MTNLFPALDKILAADHEVRLYALNGVASTFASSIEDAMFWCYVAASGRPTLVAADEFYRHVRFSWKQPLVNEAVQKKLASTPGYDRWTGLNRRLQKLLGHDENNRNLVSHNPVALHFYVVNPLSLSVKGTTVVVQPKVSQSSIQVRRGKRKPRTVGVPEMADYCRDLSELYLDLENFLEEVLGYPMTHPERCALS